jgi:hypothetical protein
MYIASSRFTRFEDMTTEFLLLWCHFLWPCIAIVILISCIGQEIRKSMALISASSADNGSNSRAPTAGGSSAVLEQCRRGIQQNRNEIKKSQRRLHQMASVVGALCLIQLGTNIWSSEILDAWNTAFELDFDCQSKGNLFSKHMEYGFTSGQKICEASDNTLVGRKCTGACHYLLFPTNFQDSWSSQYQMYFEASEQADLKEEFSRLVFSEGGTYLQFRNNTTLCNCPCSKMVKPKAPPVKWTLPRPPHAGAAWLKRRTH